MRKPTLYQMLEYLGIELTAKMKTVLRALKRGKVNENNLAERMEIRVNDVRKLMYALSHKGYVTYSKERSENKKWWYIYIWQLNQRKILQDYLRKKSKELASAEGALEKAKKHAFRCTECREEYTTHQALEAGYMCPECDGHLEEVKRRTTAGELERKAATLKEDVKAAERLEKDLRAARKKAEAEKKLKEREAKKKSGKGKKSKSPRKTKLMKKYEKETGGKAIWQGKITKTYKKWRRKRRKKRKK